MLDEDGFKGLVGDIHALEQRKKAIEDELDALKGALREEVKAGEEFEFPDLGLRVVVSTNRRFNPRKAATWLTKEQAEQVQTTQIDGKKFKALFPDLWDQAQDEYAPKIMVKEAD